MKYEIFKELERMLKGKILYQVSLKRYTSLRVGGIADIMIYPATIKELQTIITFSHRHSIPFCIIGRGTNLLIKDGGIRGIVIKLSRCCNTIKTAEPVRGQVRLTAGAGVSLQRLLLFAVNRNLSGLEFLSGIPGSLGGALAMNAGAHGTEMKDVTAAVTLLNPHAEIIEQTPSTLHFGYRHLALPKGTVILKAVLKMKRSTKNVLRSRIKKINEWRRRVQPLNYPNAGSVFKNPSGQSAGQLVEQVGLKGYTVGNAQVSEKHANFIVNRGGATAKDILTLMDIMHNKVYQATGIRLQPEICIAGENG
ncbi:MAG: UDP-N-acetylmuramate dehydrogenase [Thermodesulfobacteriota bacterium]|nr:UDP-N-acetylmuramate dehydrogenase [Thermodesulfobacteriota bacterium]